MTALILKNIEGAAVLTDPSAATHRETVLAEAKTITAVSSEWEQEMCVGALQKVNGLIKLVESSRTEVKAPVLKLTHDIDRTAKSFVEPLEAEKKRLDGLNTQFVIEQRKRREEAERQRRAEEDRIAAEKRKAEEAARAAAEKERQAAEAAFMADGEAELAAAEQLAKAEADRLKAEAAAAQAAQQKPTVAVPIVNKPSGVTVRETWTFDVLDMAEVYKAHPEFCEVTIRKSVVNGALAKGLRECPGLRIYPEIKAVVRS